MARPGDASETQTITKDLHPRKILVTAVSGLGNLLLFTPALAQLRSRYLHSRIDILVEDQSCRAVAKHLPEVNRVFELAYGRSHLEALKSVAYLRRCRYKLNLTAFPSNKMRFHLLAAAVGAENRISHSYPDCTGFTLQWLQTELVPALRGLHDIEQNLRLVEGHPAPEPGHGNVPHPRFPLTNEMRRFASQYFASNGINSPVVAIHPGSARKRGQLAKRWPLENFVTLVGLLVEQGAAVLVLCGPDERETRKKLGVRAAQTGWSGVYFPEGSILQMGAIIERC